MDWSARLTQAVSYLENNLENAVDIETAAELANCSLFHFCRMFEVVFEASPAEYVRKRRLSRAALDLAADNARVIDVALRYGWDTPESFAKSFKRCFGITPSDAKQPGVSLEIWPPIQIAIILKGDTTMKYRIEKKPSFTLTGVVIKTTDTDNQNLRVIPEFWFTKSQEGVVGILAKQMGSMGLFGVCYDYKPKDNSFSYAIAIEKTENKKDPLPDYCEIINVPDSTYAVFDVVGEMPKSIQNVWQEIYSQWFPSSEYEHAGSPDFEVYPEQKRSDITGSSPEYRSEIWIPIRKRI